MPRFRALSPVARAVLAALLEQGDAVHGYDLCRRAGIKSGTLYPLLIRWETQGWLTAEWRPSPEPGRPPRHVYRLTAEGRRQALAAQEPAGAANMLPGRAAT